jgi:hypothetical protein
MQPNKTYIFLLMKCDICSILYQSKRGRHTSLHRLHKQKAFVAILMMRERPRPCEASGVSGREDGKVFVAILMMRERSRPCEAAGVSGREDGYAGIEGFGMTGPSFGTDARGAKAGMD